MMDSLNLLEFGKLPIFTSDTPGNSCLYTYKDKTIYDLIDHLKQYGLYFAERRED